MPTLGSCAGPGAGDYLAEGSAQPGDPTAEA